MAARSEAEATTPSRLEAGHSKTHQAAEEDEDERGAGIPAKSRQQGKHENLNLAENEAKDVARKHRHGPILVRVGKSPSKLAQCRARLYCTKVSPMPTYRQ